MPNPDGRAVGRKDDLPHQPDSALALGRSHVQQYLPLLPFAIEQIDLGAAELVISSSHLLAKGALTAPDQLRIGYVHTPVRCVWDQMHAYLLRSALARSVLGLLIRWQMHALRTAWSTHQRGCAVAASDPAEVPGLRL